MAPLSTEVRAGSGADGTDEVFAAALDIFVVLR